MSMKLSRRDRIIFIIGIVLIILVVGAVLVIKPKYEEEQATAERLAQKEEEKRKLEEKIATLPGLKQKLADDVDAVLDKQQLFLSEDEYQESYQIDMYLIALLEENEIEVTSTKLADVEGLPLDPYVVKTNTAVYDLKAYSDIAHQLPDYFYYAYEKNWPADPPSKNVAVSQVTIGYQTDAENWEGIYNTIDRIAQDKKAIYLDTIGAQYVDLETLTNVEGAASPEEENPYIQGEMVITVYELNYMNKDHVNIVNLPEPEENLPAEE